ncbi:MAG: glycosyltransferase family 2 protein [Calditrichaeota bacterium]|nr:glycosyltransferase family 2 protein [Calditrichota bacterium]MCB9368401.1 glycosyltransferase family 2 protein [Calditrichota bacterium]
MIPRRCVSVVVVTYNSEATISQCIESVLGTAENWIDRVVVVDNASADRSREIVGKYGPPLISVENNDNLGFAAACNCGAKRCKSEFLLFLNPDARLDENALAELVSFLDARDSAACCGPVLHDENNSADPACRRGFPTPSNSIGKLFGFDRLFPASRRFAGYGMPWLGFAREARVDCISGACFLMRREDFVSIDGFDEQFFLFGEDIDLFKRISDLGREVWFVPSARVTHLGGQSMKQNSHTADREFYRAMRLYMSKHWRNLSAPTYKLVEMGVGLRAWLERVIGH